MRTTGRMMTSLRKTRGGKEKREDLDYRHMQTLEFEDDEYSLLR